MKLTYRTPDGRMEFSSDVQTVKAGFELVASIQEVFQECDCGQCGSKNIRLDVRESKGFTFYSWRCNECHARLDFGQRKVGETLFVKRQPMDENDKPKSHKRGWYHYDGDKADSPVITESKAPDKFDSPQHAVAWAMDEKLFVSETIAKAAYERLKSERKPKSAQEMASIWVEESRKRHK